jgi:uncharacterized membrane protein
MTQDNPPPENPESNEYDLKPSDIPARPKPGDPDFVPPVPIIERAEPEAPAEEPVDPDVTNNKAMAILAYVLFLIPLVAAPKSKFARFHANQGLLVFIVWCIAIFLLVFTTVGYSLLWSHLWSIPVVQGMLTCFCQLVLPVILVLGSLALTVMGIIQAANGEWKGLPLIGHMRLIK